MYWLPCDWRYSTVFSSGLLFSTSSQKRSFSSCDFELLILTYKLLPYGTLSQECLTDFNNFSLTFPCQSVDFCSGVCMGPNYVGLQYPEKTDCTTEITTWSVLGSNEYVTVSVFQGVRCNFTWQLQTWWAARSDNDRSLFPSATPEHIAKPCRRLSLQLELYFRESF